MHFTQKEMEHLIKQHPFTKDTSLEAGMHIYGILKADQDGAIANKGYNLVFHDVLLDPTEKDWENWENSPDNTNKSRWKEENSGPHFSCANASDLSDRAVMSAQEIFDFELSRPGKNFFVAYSYEEF